MFYIMLAVAALITTAGFYKFVYFLSTGYAFSIVGLSLAMIIGFWPTLTFLALILLLFIALYATRLGIFLVIREYKSGAYRVVFDEASSGYANIPFFVKIIIWIFCSVLYVMQVSPVFFRLHKKLQDFYVGWLCAGILLVAGGLLIQAIADKQKNRAKKENPKMFCNVDFLKQCVVPTISAKFLSGPGSLCHPCPA